MLQPIQIYDHFGGSIVVDSFSECTQLKKKSNESGNYKSLVTQIASSSVKRLKVSDFAVRPFFSFSPRLNVGIHPTEIQ